MKKYSFCLFLFLFASIVCLGAGYGITRYREGQEERQNMPSETASEEVLAETAEKETEARQADQKTMNNYYLVCEEGFLLVFCRDKTTVCLYTHVPITDFPEEE